jgi:chemotaxis regulatin CheY-phosphate phosphatase CheZ
MSDVQTHIPAKRWRIWSGITVVFVCGLLVGNVVTTAFDEHKQQQKWQQGLSGLKPRVMKYLTRELHLSPEQQQAIEVILSDAEGELLRLRMAQQPQVETTVTRTMDALKVKLSVEQQNKLEELNQQLHKRWDLDHRYVGSLPPKSQP